MAVTAVLLYLLLRTQERGRASSDTGVAQHPVRRWLPFLVLFPVILALTASAALHTYGYERDLQVTNLLAAVSIRQRELEGWLWERQKDARLIHTSSYLGEAYRSWRQGDAEAGRRLQEWLSQFISPHGFHAISLIDPQGQTLWASPEAPPRLIRYVSSHAALAGIEGRVYRIGPYLGLRVTP
ncbi:hypothetical protein GWK36_09210 [Caldichromatium japonicum]|uniref:Uncharacterized protein n=1 Tax=Caldichromatium japonicum TaxID=2699430 RepID=A0A6G7VDN4_9GAMM|nr:hypothetical protein [Caldichromatium japonicum]QIK38131.1 hypothetical protein GWK36_09210 [Caldichromatium japonicum]